MGIRSLWKVSWVNSRRVNASRGEIEEGLRGKMLAVDFALCATGLVSVFDCKTRKGIQTEF